MFNLFLNIDKGGIKSLTDYKLRRIHSKLKAIGWVILCTSIMSKSVLASDFLDVS